MAQHTPAALLAHVGEVMGIPGLAFDEDGDCQFLIDENLELGIQNEEDRLVVFATVCRFSSQHAAAVAREIARANYFWAGTGGATLGLNEIDNTVVMAEQFRLETLDPARFAETLDGFVKIAQYWDQRLAAIASEEDAEAATEAETAAPGRAASASSPAAVPGMETFTFRV